jgi:hypothetical protein
VSALRSDEILYLFSIVSSIIKLVLIGGLKVYKTEMLSTVACIVLEGIELHMNED